MRIKKITSQSRRDFSAILVCGHCEAEEKLTTGYDDSYYHQNVIPAMVCKSCGKDEPISQESRVLAPRYSDSLEV